MIKAAIFDMDGLLIDSEPLWRAAEKEIFKTVGIKLDEKSWGQTMAFKVDEIVEYWWEKHPWHSPSRQEMAKKLIEKMIDLVDRKGRVKSGVGECLEFFKNKGIKIALASSSPMKLINPVLNKFKIREYFTVVYSAEFEKSGKPDPSVYLTTSKKLKVKPSQCLVFEDSLNGVVAAKRAGMIVVCVPDRAFLEDERLKMADLVLTSLREFDEEIFERLSG